jgi:DNA adenine methylase
MGQLAAVYGGHLVPVNCAMAIRGELASIPAMIHYTPLRYPGGKRRLFDLVVRLLEHNDLSDIEYVEPFAGGAGVALALLFQDYASTVHLNDFCPGVYAVWHTILNETEWLCRRIESVKVSMQTWKRQRAVYDRRDTADLDDLGFAALFLNRTNRSGIIRGGVIGGKAQTGDWSLDVRFNKPALIERIRKIRRFRDRITLHRMDAHDFTKTVVRKMGGKPFIFFDPPYIERCNQLYLNEYTVDDHRKLSEQVACLRHPWIVTYDLAALKHELYGDLRRIVYSLRYTAHTKHTGQEVMYFSDRLELPQATKLLVPRMQLVRHKCRLSVA